MKSKIQQKNQHRLLILLAVIICWIALISGRMVQLGVFERDFLLDKAKEQQEMTVVLEPKRGHVFDRDGTELAISIEVYSVYAVPQQIESISFTANELSKILSIQYSKLSKALKSDRRFVWVKRKVSPREADQVRALQFYGIGLLKESKRFYPKKELASHVIGFVGIDNNGLEGLEHYFESEIKGEPGKILNYIDAKRRGVLPEGITLREPTGGKGVVLTVDEVIQHITEQMLQEGVKANSARSGSVIVMDPNTGEILAMANVPTYDPNRFSRYPADFRRNRAITDCFEPGSTFKIAMAGAAIEYGLVGVDELFDCSEGSIMLARHTVKDYRTFGMLSFRQIIEFSSNVGAIKAGQRLNKMHYCSELREFGFGEKSQINLPGESRGILRPYHEWSEVSTGAISIGYEIAVTPLQLISFISAVANGGYLLKPRVVHSKVTLAGSEEKEPLRHIRRRIFSENTAKILKNLMEGVVLDGTGKKAAIKGYRIAGKTGTAQKIGPSGSYSNSLYTASFVGFFPVSRPQIAIIVVIDEPKGRYYGGDVSAPIFNKIAKLIIRYLRIAPDDITILNDSSRKVASNEIKKENIN